MRKEEAQLIAEAMTRGNQGKVFEAVVGKDGHWRVKGPEDFEIQYSWQFSMMAAQEMENRLAGTLNQIGQMTAQIGGMLHGMAQGGTAAPDPMAFITSPAGKKLL